METSFLTETKSVLKSLVLSCPNGMTMDKLNRDYREMVGNWIPHQKLGFSNLELFLRSIPDALVVTGHGRDARIGFVSNEKLKHIDKMISAQKNVTRDRRHATSHEISTQSKPQAPRQATNPPRTQSYNASSYQTAQYPTYCTINPAVAKPSYLLPYPPFQTYMLAQALPIINNLAAAQTRRYVPPTTNGHFTKKAEPVPCTKPPENPKRNDWDTRNTTSAADPPKKPIEPAKRILSEPIPTKQAIATSNSLKRGFDQNNSAKKQPTSSSSEIPKNAAAAKSSTEDKKALASSKAELPNKAKEADRPKAKEESSSLEAQRMPRNNPQSSNKDTRSTGAAHNVSQKPSSCDKPISSQETTSRKVFEKKKTSADVSIKFPTKKAPVVDFQTQDDTEQGRSANTNGKATAASQVEKDGGGNNTKKWNADIFLPTDSSDDFDEAVPEFAANNLVFRVDFPENTVPFGKKIPQLKLPKSFVKDYVFGVFISEIHSPFKFWFHIHKDNHELDILMNQIECFYSRLYGNDLVIPKSCLTPGQVCATLYNEIWHRAEVLKNVCNNKVKVLFVDYGTVSEVEIHNVKYLPTIFGNTPAQAVRGSLSHIKPITPLWPKRAIREFLSMVTNVLLYAQVVEVDKTEQAVYMVLCDSNCEKPIQINRELVDRGFAKFDTNWDENIIAKNGYRKRHTREIFPTFEMLETGEYPSLYELELLLAQGIDYEKITEKIIWSKANNSMCDEFQLREGYAAVRKNVQTYSLLDSNPFKNDIISEIVTLKIFDH